MWKHPILEGTDRTTPRAAPDPVHIPRRDTPRQLPTPARGGRGRPIAEGIFLVQGLRQPPRPTTELAATRSPSQGQDMRPARTPGPSGAGATHDGAQKEAEARVQGPRCAQEGRAWKSERWQTRPQDSETETRDSPLTGPHSPTRAWCNECAREIDPDTFDWALGLSHILSPEGWVYLSSCGQPDCS